MKLLDISDASLTKIYCCLAKNNCEISRFARTNYRISKIAVSQKLLKMKIEDLQITYEKESKTITANLIDEHGVSNRQAYRVYHEIHSKMRTIISQQLEKVLNISKSYKSVLRLGLCRNPAVSNDNDNYVKKLTISDVKLNSMRISTMHLSIACTNIICYSDYEYKLDIDDQLLTNWLYNMPNSVDLTDFRTNITLNGVLAFIEKLSKRLMDKPAVVPSRQIFLGSVKAENDYGKQLALEQRNPYIRWNTYKDSDCGSFEVNIENQVDIHFYIDTTSYSRITRQQASEKISYLRAKITEARKLDPLYNIYDDEPLNADFLNLLENIYPDWTDLQDEIEALEDLQVNQWGEDEEDLVE